MFVLVVDDDPDFRALLERALQSRGHTVETRDVAFGLVNRVAGFTESGAPAQRPDAVILDHMLPGLPGADSLEMLAKSSRAQDVPVLMVSNGFEAELRVRVAAHSRARFALKTGRMLPLVEELELFVQEMAQDLVSVRQGAG